MAGAPARFTDGVDDRFDRRSRRITVALFVALAARADAAEERLTALQQRVNTETREASRMMERLTAARGVALSGSKLPPLSSSQTYQVWLVTARGNIGLGFVAPDAQGRVSAAFDTPPDLAGNVTGVMLSLEPTGGNAKPTGSVVLAR